MQPTLTPYLLDGMFYTFNKYPASVSNESPLYNTVTTAIYLTTFLYIAVRYKDLLDDPYTDLANLLKSYGDVCAIVYCLERTTCDDLAMNLSNNGISCAGKLPPPSLSKSSWIVFLTGPI